MCVQSKKKKDKKERKKEKREISVFLQKKTASTCFKAMHKYAFLRDDFSLFFHSKIVFSLSFPFFFFLTFASLVDSLFLKYYYQYLS